MPQKYPGDQEPTADHVVETEFDESVDLIRIKLCISRTSTQIIDIKPQDAMLLISELANALRVREGRRAN